MSGFVYRTGNAVRVGDRVSTGDERRGTVVQIIERGSPEALDYQCSKGGILIQEDWGGLRSLLLLEPPDGRHWEDLDFISRAAAKKERPENESNNL
jgi:hypothetical protein